MTDTPEPRFLFDPYLDWAGREGVPIVEDFGVDLLKVETKRWARLGTNGALVHLKGRGDFVSMFVIDLEPGAKSAPQRHLFEEVIYVLDGHGSTTIETADYTLTAYHSAGNKTYTLQGPGGTIQE